MAIGVGDILRVACQFLADSTDQSVNVHTFEVDDLGTTTGDTDFATQLAETLVDELFSIIVGDLANNLVGTIMTSFNLTKNEVVPPVPFVITGLNSSADSLARQVTGLVYLNTGVPRRQGRTYLPPFAENNLDDNGRWGATTVAHLSAFGLALLDPITDGDIVVHRVVCRPSGANPVVPTVAGVSLAPRTQRRRTPGRGS